MKTYAFLAVFLGVSLWPSVAYLSGSSTVHADSQYFRVEMESVRKVFGRDSGDAEGDWHREWKKEHQPEVNRLKKKIEPDIGPLVEKYGLLPFRGGLPIVLDETQETDEAKEALQSKKPFELRFRYMMVSVSVVVPKLPSKAAMRELRKTFQKYMPRD